MLVWLLVCAWVCVWVVTQVRGWHPSPTPLLPLRSAPSHKYSLSLFHFNFETTALNATVYKVFNPCLPWRRRFLGAWFNAGVYFMGIGQLITSLLLLRMTAKLAWAAVLHTSLAPKAVLKLDGDAQVPTDLGLVPLLPGVNLPANYLILFWIAMFVSVAVHEVGHAAAAAMERLQIQGFGFFFAFVFPGAYVRIEDSLQYIPMWSQLKVYSAGVWHNLVFTLFCFFALASLPTLLLVAYVPAEAVCVAQVPFRSPLEGAITVGNTITKIHGLRVTSTQGMNTVVELLRSEINSQTISAYAWSSMEQRLMKAAQNHVTSHQKYLDSRNSSHSPRLPVVVTMPGYCVTMAELERLSVHLHAENPLACCTQVLAPWMGLLIDESSYDSCFVHNPSTVSNQEDKHINRRKSHGSGGQPTQLRSEKRRLSNDHSPAGHLRREVPGRGQVATEATSTNFEDTVVRRWRNSRSFEFEPPLEAKANVDPDANEAPEAYDESQVLPVRESISQDPATVNYHTNEPEKPDAHPNKNQRGPDSTSHSQLGTSHSYTLHCLSARSVYEESAKHRTLEPTNTYCETDNDCYSNGPKAVCIRPVTKHPTAMLEIELGSGKSVLFEGDPAELTSAIQGADFELNAWFTWAKSFDWIHSSLLLLPGLLRILLLLCANMSLSVAALNMMPVHHFDGAHACKQFCRILFPQNWRRLSDTTVWIFTALLGLNIAVGVAPLVYNSARTTMDSLGY